MTEELIISYEKRGRGKAMTELCLTCIRGAPADKHGDEYFCTVKGGMRRSSENRRGYLERSKVKAKTECESYISRAYYGSKGE